MKRNIFVTVKSVYTIVFIVRVKIFAIFFGYANFFKTISIRLGGYSQIFWGLERKVQVPRGSVA